MTTDSWLDDTVDAVELFDPDELKDTVLGDIRDPFPTFAEARARGAVVRGMVGLPEGAEESIGAEDAPEVFSVVGHDAVQQVLFDHETFSSTVYSDVMGMVMGRTMLEMDEPEHRLYRGLVSVAFRQKVLARWERDLVRVVVDDLIDKFAGRGHAELVRELTFHFPAQVIARILGLPRHDFPKFQRWSIELISVSANWDRGIAASQALKEYFSEVLADRRKHPKDDLISDLAQAEVDGHTLDDESIYAFLRLLLPAGVETTYRASGNLLFGLLTNPDQLEAVKNDRNLVGPAFEETLRWEPPLTFIMRVAAKDTELAGVAIPKGSVLSVGVAAAGRDPSRYPDPDRFDLFRNPQPHVSFGFGPHMCIGMHLARMEARVALEAVLDRLPNVRLDPGDSDPHIHGMAFRSPTSLPVRFG